MPADSGLRLTSQANAVLKAVRKAARRGRATDDGLWLAESPHLLEEAAASGAEVACVLLADGATASARQLAESFPGLLRLVANDLFAELATTEHSQGLMALVRPREWTLGAVLGGEGPVLVLDRVADPGNVGAMARSAEAFGAAGLILTPGCAHPENPKTLRASAGALFRLPFVAGVPATAIVEACTAANRALLAASAHEGRSIRETLPRGCAIVIGSETHGVSQELAAAAQPIHVPTKRVESLNAAMAAAIILYQAAAD